MKYLRIIFLVVLISAIVIEANATDRYVSYPSYCTLLQKGDIPSLKPKSEFRITAISATSERTVISCELNFYKTIKTGAIYVNEDCLICYRSADSVVLSKLVGVENIDFYAGDEPSSDAEYVYNKGEKRTFNLIFGPLPDGVGSLDFFGNTCDKWQCVNISLENGASSRNEQKIGRYPYEAVITTPTFNGEDPRCAFSEWVNSYVIYPAGLRDKGITGKVEIEIQVKEDGDVMYRVLEKTHPQFALEVLRVVCNTPSSMWTPLLIRGKAVECRYTFPVIFMLK